MKQTFFWVNVTDPWKSLCIVQPTCYFFPQANLKWEMPLMQTFSVVAELVSFWGVLWLFSIFVALSVKPYVAALTNLHGLQLPVRSRAPCLGVTAVSLGLGESQLLLVFLCSALCWSAWHRRTDVKAAHSISYQNEVWRNQTEENLYIFMCIFLSVFLDGCIPPHMQRMKI